MKTLKKLPIGRHTFSTLINENFLYIDKTKDIHNLISCGECYFISRPRRFGKSLLVSTLREIFLGNKDLFKGLYIYDKVDWKEHPVIELDLSGIPHDTEERLTDGLIGLCRDIARKSELVLEEKYYDSIFKELITKLCEKNKEKVVILIDEYDKPIIDAITDKDKALRHRDIARNFYSMIKACDRYIKFIFITGVSKFSKVSIFSGLNNLEDITFVDKYATLMGITQQELEAGFSDYIDDLSVHLSVTKQKLIEDIRIWYNGYSWDGKTRLYNPFSLLSLFSARQFGNWWFSTGTPTFLVNYIKNHNIDIPVFESEPVSSYIFDSYDIDNIDISSLMLQTGYLTVQKVQSHDNKKEYELSYPNKEVKESFLNYIASSYTGEAVSKVEPLYNRIKECLKTGNIEEFMSMLRGVMAGIPYTLQSKQNEAYFHSLFYLVLSLMGANIDLEVLTDKGRIDAVLEFDNKIYIIEFKLGTADEALKQIQDKKYYERFIKPNKRTILLGVGGFFEKNLSYRHREL